MSYGRVAQKAGYWLDKQATDWLYGPWDKQKLAFFEVGYALPFTKQWLDYKLDLRADQEYLAQNNLGYEDVHDPRKLSQSSSGAALIGSAYHMVSRNVDSLYEDSDKKKKKR